MKLKNALLVSLSVAALAACGDNNVSKNNTSTNNTSTNNTSTNNTSTNNTSMNNTSTNNTSTNNTSTNNTSTNNTNTNSSTNNGTNNTTNNSTNNGTNNGTNNTNNTNNGNALTCDGSFGANDACGGDPTGIWDISEACSDYDYTNLIDQTCADATVNDVTIAVSGTLTVAGNAFTQAVTGTATADVNFANRCNANNCNTLEAIIANFADTANCTDDGNTGCDCDLTFDAGNTSAGTFTTNNGVVTLSTGETYYYCESADTMLLREFGTTNDDAQPAYLYTLQ